MTTIFAPPPPPPSFSSRNDLAAAPTKGPDRKFSGHHPPPGSATPPSFSFLSKRPAFLILALLAALAVGLLFLLPGGLLHAQDADGPIMYAENGTGAVATLTAVDPEGKSIVWSLATGADMDNFSIENGVLRFNNPPDFEMATDADTDNTYVVTVQASDGGQDTTATEEVTIEVTTWRNPER